MSAAEQLQQLGHDKVLEARMAEIIGTTTKPLPLVLSTITLPLLR